MIREYPFIESARDRSGSNKTILNYLVETYGVCYHCNKKVHYQIPQKGKKQKQDSATIDHLVSRYFRKKHEKVPKVLSCYACNQRRAVEECERYSKSLIKNS